MSIQTDVKECTKSFWKYASQIKGTADIENVFIDWAAQNSQELTLSNIQDIWNTINQDVFDIRTAFNADAFKMILDNVLEGTASPEEEKIVEEVSNAQGGSIPAAMQSLGNEVKPAHTETVKSVDKPSTPTPDQASSGITQNPETTVDSNEVKGDEKILAESLLL
jgi:hypothetical protein